MKKKILWFSNTPANGIKILGKNIPGSGTWLQQLNENLEDKVELTIAFHHDSNIIFKHSKTTYIGISRGDSFLSKFLFKIKERFLNYIPNEDYIEKYIDVINICNPDVIHIHGTENSFGCILKRTKIPVVTSIQGNITVYLKKFNIGIQNKYLNTRDFSSNSWKKFFFPTTFKNAKKKFIKMSSIEKKNLLICKHIIGRTDWDRRIMKVMSPNSIYYHNDEIIRDEFFKCNWKDPGFSNGMKLFTISDNVTYKGFEDICATSILLDSLGVNFVWSVAGLNDRDLIVKICKKLFGKEYPQKNIKLLGRLNADEIITIMMESHLYIMPSHIENSPNSLSEALVLGMPCISTFVGGAGKFINDGIDGLLVQDGDPWHMAGAIMELYENKNLRIQMSNSARDKARKRHDIDEIVNQLIKIYTTLDINSNNSM